MKTPLPVAEIFSQLVRDALVRAAATRIVSPTDRIRAIEKATKYAQQQHPQLFKKDRIMKIKLTNVRLAFPQLFEAKTVNGEGKPAFSAAFLIDPADPQVKAINAAIEQVAKEKWGAKADAMLTAMRKADKVALHDGDLKATYDGFPGNLYISARSATRPLVINCDKSPLTEADGKPYAGCFVNASVELWAQDNNYGKRINARLGGVQFARDGDAFAGGGAASEDEFDDLSAGATADSLV